MAMAVDGAWIVVVDSPTGKQETRLELRSEGTSLKGRQSSATGSFEIKDGKINGDKISWSVSVTQPREMTLEFSAVVAGNAMTGSVKAGNFGTFRVTGTRA
jgi:hypothetical protein